MNKEFETEIREILEKELPISITEKINRIYGENIEEENKYLDEIYKDNINKIMCFLTSEYKIMDNNSAGKVGEFIYEYLKDNITKIINKSHEKKCEEDIVIARNKINSNSQELDFESEEKYTQSSEEFKNRTVNQIEEIIVENNNVDNTFDQIDDSVKNELSYELRKILYECNSSENYDVVTHVNYILNELCDKIKELYIQASQKITEESKEMVENEFGEAINATMEKIKVVDEIVGKAYEIDSLMARYEELMGIINEIGGTEQGDEQNYTKQGDKPKDLDSNVII